ncbi:MAG: AmmeMemoRadiSam system radical SAM enzyme [bacterium]|nr:AmmeMemoRadiSam system radical SAM enzyme [bacterium]
MREALVYEKLKEGLVRCQVCQRRCLVAEGKTGFCLTKRNKGGKLVSLNYGLIRGVQLDPIEKKPFYHFRPGAWVPSIGNFGCNFRCKQCLNWWCSWGEPAQILLRKILAGEPAEIIKPEQLISDFKKAGYKSIAFTYNEPVVWAEYVLDASKLAKQEGFFTVFVTNGSWTKETLDKIGKFIDAANIDFKGFSDKTYSKMGAFFGQVPEMAKYAQEKHKIFIEITTLLIPGINDGKEELEEMTRWMVKHLGPKTPWHLSRFDPDLAPDKSFQALPQTSVKDLDKAAAIGKKSGLKFIYIWAPGQNLPGGLYAQGNTFCPKCGQLAIERTAWQPKLVGIDKNGCCSNCQEDLNVKL